MLDLRQKVKIYNLTYLDGLLSLVLILLTCLYAFCFFDFSAPPFEDAAMLMRYSQHFAQGDGIVWNIGEQPVDGATDFLFMVFVGLVHQAGLSLVDSARLLALLAHLMTIVMVYLGIRHFSDTHRWLALISAGFLAIGPGLAYIEAAFGTPVFALFATLTFMLALRIIEQKESIPTAIAFALSGLITGLVRPEGVFLASFILLSVLVMNGFRGSLKTLAAFLVIFLFLGGGYFLWRWDYFGYPLPNPFYKKGSSQLHLDSLSHSIANIVRLSFPFSIFFALGLRSKRALQRTIAFIIPIVGFVGIWILLSDEMNYQARFQYPILPILLLAYPMVLSGLIQEWKWPDFNSLTGPSRLALIALIVTFVSYIFWRQHTAYAGFRPLPDGRADVALILKEYDDEQYTISTSEAGLLPLYSGWRAVDSWGLNDQWIAHHGEITASYLALQQPDLIVFNDSFAPIVPTSISNLSGWDSMVTVLRDYIDQHNYCLVAAFGEIQQGGVHHYYIHPELARKHPTLIQRIQNVEYFSGYHTFTGKAKLDYAKFSSDVCK